jgi:thymidylate kinase
VADDVRGRLAKSINVSVIAPAAYLRCFVAQSPATVHHVAAQRVLQDPTYRAFFLEEAPEVPMSADLSAYVDAVNAVVYRRKASVGAACGDRYWLFALAAWYSLQDQLIIRPPLEAGTHVLLDQAPHKIIARYAVNPEVPTDLARAVFADLTTPDVVLGLRVAAEEALRRKGEFTALEAGHTGSTGEAFVAYQARVTEELRTLEADPAWVALDVTDKAPDIVLDEALGVLSERLGFQLA